MSPTISRLELHVTHACNLACESCSHFSNHGHVGNLDLEDADRWMSLWSRRVAVGDFILLGGEPTIHPDLPDFVYLVRRHWPDANIQITTNGFFLDRHPRLPQALADCGKTLLFVSIHHGSPRYEARVGPNLRLAESWAAEFRIKVVTTPSYQYWTRRYLSFGSKMLPFEDNDRRQSWAICGPKMCKQLHDGKLWKCSPITYLQLQRAKFDLSPKWDRYLEYRPLTADCDDESLLEFIGREDEDICTMCSAFPRKFELPDPLVRHHQLQPEATSVSIL